MLIHTFCKIFEHEIVLQKCETKTISGSQLLQNRGIIKQTVLLLWKKLKKIMNLSRIHLAVCLCLHFLQNKKRNQESKFTEHC